MAAEDALGTDGLHELAWDQCDALLGDGLVASPADARGRGISLTVARGGEPCDLAGARLYLAWRHREGRVRGLEEFEAVDAAAGRFRLFYPAAMAGREGTVDAQVVASWGDRSLSTRSFSIRVEKVLAGGKASEDGFTILIEAIKRYEDAADLVEGVTGEARDAAADARAAASELLRARDAGEFDGRDGRDGVVGRDGVDGKPGRDGLDGQPGKDGRDGVSPSASVAQTGDGAVVTVTDASGTTTALLSNGRDGRDGIDGVDGKPGRDGVDGVSPTAKVEQNPDGSALLAVSDATGETTATLLRGPEGKRGPAGADGSDGKDGAPGRDGSDGTPCTHSWEGSVLTVTSASGSSSADLRGPQGLPGKDGGPGAAGKPGADGRDGVSPSAKVEATDAGAVVTVTDASGTTTATLLHGERGPAGKDGRDGQPGAKGDPGEPGRDGSPGAAGRDGADGVSVTHSWDGSVLTVTSASGTSSADLRGPAGADGASGAASGTVHLVDRPIGATNNSSSIPVAHGSLAVGDLVIDPERNLGRVTALTQVQMETDAATVEFVTELRPPRLGTTENVHVEPGEVSGSSFRVVGRNLGVGDLALSVNTGCLMRVSSLAVGYSDYVEARLEGVCNLATRTMAEVRVTRSEMEEYVKGQIAGISDLSGELF